MATLLKCLCPLKYFQFICSNLRNREELNLMMATFKKSIIKIVYILELVKNGASLERSSRDRGSRDRDRDADRFSRFV